MDDSPIPDGLDPTSVLEFIKLAFENFGYLGSLIKVRAYCKDMSELVSYCRAAEIFLQNRVSKVGYAEVDHMLVDILTWGLYNPAPSNLMVISKNITEETELVGVLGDLKLLNYNILVASVGEDASGDLVCLSARLFGGGKPVDQSISSHGVSNKLAHDIKTGIFWNITGCTFPNDIHLDELNQNIKLAIENQGHHGEVSIKAYWQGGGSGLYNWLHGTITLQTRVSNGRYMKVDTMFVDILLWALDNPAPSNLMVISNTISHETELSSLLQDLESKGYNILVAHAEEAASPVLPPACLEWRLDTLFAGGNPINRTNYSRDGNTGIFWSIEDCPIPSGLDPLTFFFDVKKVLPGRNVSVMAYCNQNRSLDDFSLNDNLHITLVHTADKYARIKKMFKDIFLWALENPESNVMVITKSIPFNISDVIHEAFSSRNYNLVLADPHGVAYVNSVWLSTSLFGGGDPIDPSGRKNLPSSIEVMTKLKITS
ncbi:hypothetical protein Bca52824_008393 [Brassica carinata]|uniref:NYN domain-containing protein n=1 Tax=Brassica carinata TaxID=52824 RepID=A0A8X7WB69_BRACI|nr:hypothetical protein Bca52824_008393 [Brassica carinata]